MRLHFRPLVFPVAIGQHITLAHPDPIEPTKEGDDD